MKKLLYFLIASILLFLTGCTGTTPVMNEEKVTKVTGNSPPPYIGNISNSSKGMSHKLYKMDGTIENDINFSINENEFFEKYVAVGNFVGETWNYKLIVLVDYIQSSFSVNGTDYLFYDFTLKTTEKSMIPVRLPKLEAGNHDVIFIVANYPDVKRLDNDFRRQTYHNHIIPLRCSVLVGNATAKIIDYEKSDKNNYYDFSYFTYNKKANETAAWYTETVTKNFLMNYSINIGIEKGKEAKKYAVVTLFDWKQVPINGDCLVKYIELADGKSTNIISQLKTPNEPGVYDLCPLIIHNPYTELSYDNRNVETGFRVGIVVE